MTRPFGTVAGCGYLRLPVFISNMWAMHLPLRNTAEKLAVCGSRDPECRSGFTDLVFSLASFATRGRKERTVSVNEITFERDRRIFSNASTTGIFATSRSCPILYSLETHLNLKVKR